MCTGEYAGVSADASVHDTCQRVVYLAAEHLSVGLLFSRCNEAVVTGLCPLGQVADIHPVALLVLLAGQVVGVVHAQYVEDVFLGKLAQ